MYEVFDFLKKCGTYYLATVEGDQPRVRPFGTVDVFEGKMYIQTGKVKDVSKQLQENPKAEICAFCDGVWLRIACNLVRDENVKAKEHMLEAYPSLKGMYSPYDDNTEVLYLEDAVATFSSFTEEPRTIRFEILRQTNFEITNDILQAKFCGVFVNSIVCFYQMF